MICKANHREAAERLPYALAPTFSTVGGGLPAPRLLFRGGGTAQAVTEGFVENRTIYMRHPEQSRGIFAPPPGAEASDNP